MGYKEMPDCPETEKARKFAGRVHIIREFFNWLQSENIEIVKCESTATPHLVEVAYEKIDELLAKYFGIDLEAMALENHKIKEHFKEDE